MPPKKRKGSGKQADTKTKQPKQEGQKAVSHDIEVPLDEGFKGGGKSAYDCGWSDCLPLLPTITFRECDSIPVQGSRNDLMPIHKTH